jgi:hypothetical protein
MTAKPGCQEGFVLLRDPDQHLDTESEGDERGHYPETSDNVNVGNCEFAGVKHDDIQDDEHHNNELDER